VTPKLQEFEQYRSALHFDLVNEMLDMIVPGIEKARRPKPISIQGSSVALYEAIFTAFRAKLQGLMGSDEFEGLVGKLLDPSSYHVTPGPPSEVVFTPGVLEAFHRAADAQLGRPFASDLAENVRAAVAAIYLSGRESAARQLRAPAGSITGENRSAIRVLGQQTLFWIGEAYDDVIRRTINQTIAGVVARGLPPREGAVALKLALGETFERSDAYWYVVAHAAMGRAANYGALSRYVEAEIESYEWISVIDASTTAVCLYMDGRVFNVVPASGVMNSVLQANTPGVVRTAHPWLRFDRKRALDGKNAIWFRTTRDGLAPDDPADDLRTRSYLPDSGFDFTNGAFAPKGDPGDRSVNVTLEQLGKILPPLHGRCRSDTVVSAASVDSYLGRGEK
jgi:SPP1 gp7 family putative phage head morphogenesis protein